jgi:hypothetical protein
MKIDIMQRGMGVMTIDEYDDDHSLEAAIDQSLVRFGLLSFAACS